MHLTFQLNWVFQGPNSPFLHAADAGYFSDLGLDVTFVEGKSSATVVADIGSGAADLGFGDIPATIERHLRTGAGDVACLMPVYRRSPSCLATLAPLALADLAGTTIAGPPGDTTAKLLPLLLRRAGLAEMPYSFETVTPEARDRGLVAGTFRAVTCFDSTIRFSFADRGLDPDRLRFLYLADCGLDLLSAALVAAPKVAGDAGLVAGLTAAVRRAWAECRADPGLGVAAVARRRPEADPAITRAHLQWVLDHQVFPPGASADAFGGLDPAAIATTIACVESLTGIDAPADLAGRLFATATA